MMRSSLPSDDAGFSLIEMLIVLAILALAISMFAATPPWAKRTTLVSSARAIQALLDHARYLAIMRAAPVEVTIDTGKREIALGDDKVQLSPGVSLTATVGTVAVRPAANGAIVFRHDGSSSGGRIVLADEATRIEINNLWLTGLTRITRDAH